MKKTSIFTPLTVLAILFTTVLFGSNRVFAHCDGMDGPVVTAAKNALETGNVNLVLIWVQKKDEGELKKAFEKTLGVRKLNPQAKELADMYFFETLVRIHRAGEGAPYTGLKPAGRDLGLAIPAADKAIMDGKIEPVIKLLTDKMRDGIHEYFKHVIAKKNFKKDDVEAGRKYIEAYVIFIHYVEGLYEAAREAVHGHYPEHEEGEVHKHK
jgi:Family of unknown function (DUF6448)